MKHLKNKSKKNLFKCMVNLDIRKLKDNYNFKKLKIKVKISKQKNILKIYKNYDIIFPSLCESFCLLEAASKNQYYVLT